ncbi:MAG: hypothetical protein EOM03_05945 [Clostridia bacterium]|nr:hypothetical protein [Clostridia bacterium]
MYYKVEAPEIVRSTEFFWSAEGCARKNFPVLITEMEKRGYNLPDIRKALGLKNLCDAATVISSPHKMKIADARRIQAKLFPDMEVGKLFANVPMCT